LRGVCLLLGAQLQAIEHHTLGLRSQRLAQARTAQRLWLA